MTTELSPNQAFTAAKILYPSAEYVKRIRGCDFVVFPGGESLGIAEISWPEGVSQWPLPIPKWTKAKFPRDFGKQAEFSSNGLKWVPGKITGYVDNGTEIWHCEHKAWYLHCRIALSDIDEEAASIRLAKPTSAGDRVRLIKKMIKLLEDSYKSTDHDWQHRRDEILAQFLEGI